MIRELALKAAIEENANGGGHYTDETKSIRETIRKIKGRPEVVFVVATDKNKGIGIENKLPWSAPEDLKRFKRITTRQTIIMGRKTLESLGKPLPNRRNIVISRKEISIQGVENFTSFEDAIASTKDGSAFIIGGAESYRNTIHLCDRIERTIIQGEYKCDAYFDVDFENSFYKAIEEIKDGIKFETWLRI